jgi:hypothetical protein
MNTAPRQTRGQLRGIIPSGRVNTQGPMVPVSFAKQTKSLEERLYSRFQELNPDAVRVTRYRGGTLQEELLLDAANDGNITWISSVTAEKLLYEAKLASAIKRAIMRAPVRLNIVLSDQDYQKLSDVDKEKLHMSQKDWNSFRGLQGGDGATAQSGPAQAGPGAGQGPAQA